MAETPKTPSTDPIIELVETTNPMYLALAFIAGAVIVAAIVYYIGRNAEDTSNAG